MIWVAIICIACISAILISFFSRKSKQMLQEEETKQWETKHDDMVGQPIIDFIKAWRDNPRRFRVRLTTTPAQLQYEWMRRDGDLEYILVTDKQENIEYLACISSDSFYSVTANGEELDWINYWEKRYVFTAGFEILEPKLHRRNRIKNLPIARERLAQEAAQQASRQKYIDIYCKGENE